MNDKKMHQLILELKKEVITVFLTNNNIEEAREPYDILATIRNGRIEVKGSKASLRSVLEPTHTFTITFSKPLEAGLSELLKPDKFRLQSYKL
jgi:ABC-type multidrug transport system ATPase subunit